MFNWIRAQFSPGSWGIFWRSFRMALIMSLFVVSVRSARPDPTDNDFRALGAARDHLFDFARWEGEALLDKTATALAEPERYLDATQRTRYVSDYLSLVGQIEDIEAQVEEIYADPTVSDPLQVTAERRTRRDALRIEQQQRQSLAEAIIQSQISEVLADRGFGTGGSILPPVSIRFTRLPTILILSPRDHIERTGAYPLEHGITVERMQQVEDEIGRDLGVSALIEPLGGLAVYPAMLIETHDLHSVYAIGAHEWTHHYLAFYPLGFNYGLTPELYTMNETVASLVGNEVGWEVLHRYYPDQAGPPPDYTPPPPARPSPPAQPQEFDFRGEMRITRLQVDALLAEGRIAEAEQYMEARRRMFVAHGYRLRRINQAYFAFHGSYADQPGATGSDPVGPALRELRFLSPSLLSFVEKVRGMTTFVELQAALQAARSR